MSSSVPSRLRTTRGALLLLVAALVLGACSGDDQQVDAAGVPSPTPSATASPTPSPSPSPSPSPTPTETEVALEPMPEIVRGVYAHPYSFWGGNWENLVELVEETELNAIVVDVKDEAGTLLWDMDLPLAKAGKGGKWVKGKDPSERLEMLLDAGGYPIARIACFKDTRVAKARPDLAVQDGRTGDTWIARKDFAWLNPYQDEAGQWCIDVALEAVELGFKEIQFDYIRFPNGGDGDTEHISFPGVPDDRPREEWRHKDEITEFLARASDAIHEAGAWVSADLFGLVTYDFTWDSGGTGQVIEEIAEHVDVISPMVYPSHYATGNYGLKPHPIEHPYETVWNAMQEAQMRVQGLHAEIRPWLEDFSAPWMGYPNHSPKHVTEQIRATYENGIDGWLLWNAANRYTESILALGEAKSHADPDFVPPARTADPDPAPGDKPKRWPGHAECDTREGHLFIGEGNLAGTRPGEPSPAPVEPDEDGNCPGDDEKDEQGG